jgi:hypothetical protein
VTWTRFHLLKVFRPALILIGAVAVAAWLSRSADNAIDVPIRLGLLAAVGYFVFSVIEWYCDYLVVTDRRLLLVTGLLTRRVAMMPMRKVTDMTYERSPTGLLLGYGTFVLESAGQDQAFHRLNLLPRPDKLYRDITMQVFGAPAARAAPGGMGMPPADDE